MIVINSGKMTIPEEERFIGFAGDNLHSTKQFLVADNSDENCIYRLYLSFDDGTTNYFVLDSKVEDSSTLLTWNVLTEHIFKSGIVNAQIKSFSESGEIYHTTWDYFLVAPSAETTDEFIDTQNAEFLRYERELNEIVNMINTDSAVPKSRKIAGLTLKDDITVQQLHKALTLYPVVKLSSVPTVQTQGDVGQIGYVTNYDGVNYWVDFYICLSADVGSSQYIWRRAGNSTTSDSQIFAAVEQYFVKNPVKSDTGRLNSTAISLLISILKNAVYTSDQSAIITALETALKEGGTGGSTDAPDIPQDPNKTYYSVLATVTNCTINSSQTSIVEGGVYVGQITPTDGYTIENVTITMGGKDVTSTVYSDNSISISNVTGDIVVVATAIETPNDLVYYANWNYGKRQYSSTATQDNAAWTSSDWVDVTAGQILTATLLEKTQLNGTTHTWAAGNMEIGVWFRNSEGAAVSCAFSKYMNLNNTTYPSIQDITVPQGAVSMCVCVASTRIDNKGGLPTTDDITVSSETLEGRPVWWSLVLKNGGVA